MREAAKTKELRCAIYTRKSSEEGLEQDFNSLHAQREACEAYIKSQKHEGWRALSAVYDDGGYSGGSMERPALQRLLADIHAKRIDVVVVYKVDRLTRSLMDFAKIVEVFDASGVSFVSVTQAFNTTSSMGRLTLNVLLSFAQFEREVTGERIRDKVAASKKKGLWMGGFVPFGYRSKERTLIIHADEAAIVRTIFARYLELGNVRQLEAELANQKLHTRAFTSATNRSWGNRPFSRGHLYRILSNPVYAGKIVHRGERYHGQHQAIVDHKMFGAVQARLEANSRKHKNGGHAKQPNLLAGLLVDADGTKLTASHTVKDGKRYRYYVGTRIEQGQPKPWRLPAHKVERAVVGRIQRFLADRQAVTSVLGSGSLKAHGFKEAIWAAKQLSMQISQTATQRETLLKLAKQIRVSDAQITVDILLAALIPDGPASRQKPVHQLKIPVEQHHRARSTSIVVAKADGHETQSKPALIKAIARGVTWFEELATGRIETVKAIAKRERVTDRYVSQMIDLAFLSPRIVEKVISSGRDVNVSTKELVSDIELSASWSEQEKQALKGRSLVS